MATIKFLNKTGLTYFWGKARQLKGLTYYGTCTTAAGTAAKVVTLSDSNFQLHTGSTICVKFTNTNTAQNPTLNVNNTGAKQIYYNASVVTTASAAAGYAGRYTTFAYDGTHWVRTGASYDNNTTYSNMSQTEASAGTATTARLISAKVLHDTINELIAGLGSLVTGVKGNKESTYRTGNVNLTPANIGAVNTEGDTMTGVLTAKQGTTVHDAAYGNNTGYIKFCEFTIIGTYQNAPIELTMSHRGQLRTTKLWISFKNVNGLDPDINAFYYNGINSGYYIAKLETSKWGLYTKAVGSYDHASVLDIRRSPYMNSVKVEWTSELVSELPSGYIEATLTGESLTVNGHTVQSNVPANAKFTDTKYTATTTSIGSASAGTAISADDITSWTTNTPTAVTKKTVVTSASGATASYANGILTITNGSFSTGDSVSVTAGKAADLKYTSRSIPNISVSSKTVVTGIEEA